MPPVLSLWFFLSLSIATSIYWFAQFYCQATTMPLPTMLLLYRFWQTEICICCKTHPTRDETCNLQIALLTTLPFFHTSNALHAWHIHAIFELWGRPFCSSLLVSFFAAKRNLIHTALLSHFIFLVRSVHHLFFYPAVDDCWIHINVSCSVCIYSRLFIVSLNDESQLAHRRQQSMGSAFQFHYTFVIISHCSNTFSAGMINNKATTFSRAHITFMS